ncbi:MAG: acyl-CoA thioesterase [Pseudomonadota bacterium]
MTDRYKTPSASDTTITELMVPAYANFGGKIHGGQLLSMMDKVAYACSTKHAENYCVTVAVENVNFLQPVDVGDLVSMQARVNYTGGSSMVVGIRVTAENFQDKFVKHTNTSYFTMVAKGGDGEPAKVPGLRLTSAEDVRRFADAIHRKTLKNLRRDSMQHHREDFDYAVQAAGLREENCEIDIPELQVP